MTSDTFLEIDGIAIPMRAATEFTETWTRAGTVTARRTWTGKAKILKPTFGRVWDVEIAGFGPAVWRTPSFDALKEGDEVVLWSTKWMSSHIPVGADQCLLSLEPVPGSVSVRSPETDVKIPHIQLGHLDRVIKIGALAEQRLPVIFKPKLRALLGTVAMDVSGSDGTGGWSFTLHQKEPL